MTAVTPSSLLVLCRANSGYGRSTIFPLPAKMPAFMV